MAAAKPMLRKDSREIHNLAWLLQRVVLLERPMRCCSETTSIPFLPIRATRIDG